MRSRFRDARKSTEGARDTKGPGRTQACAVCANKALGPTDLDASQHRGMLKSVKPQVRQVPRRPARGVLRSAPHRPWWTLLSGPPAFAAKAFPPLRAPIIAGCPVTGAGNTITVAQRRAVGTPGRCGLNRREGKPRRISDAPFPGHRSPPRVWRRLIRRPSVTGRDGRTICSLLGTVK